MTPPPNQSAGITRDEFMLRIHASLGPRDAESAPTPPRLPVALVRRVRAGANVIDRFCDEARRSGMTVDRAPRDRAAEHIAGLLKQQSCELALLSCADSSMQSFARNAAKQAGARAPDLRMMSRDDVFQVRASITDVDAAVAETGSLVVTSHASRARLAQLAPPLHIAIVRAEQIVPDLYDLLSDAALATSIRAAAYAALITGPSKTADIEGVLITGVHGPGAVHVVVLDSSS